MIKIVISTKNKPNYATFSTFHLVNIDPDKGPHYIGTMPKKTTTVTADKELKSLEFRLDELIEILNHLQEENRILRDHQENLVTERAQLIEKNELARTRVESIINRLKAMETG